MNILDELLKSAAQAEVLEVRSESTTIGFEANRLKNSQVQVTSGLAVRVMVDGRLGFSASSDLTAAAKLVSNAVESAAYGDQVPLAFPGPQPAPEVRTFDPAIPDLSIAQLVEMGQEIVETFLRIEPDARVNLEIKRGIQDVSIRNQAGADVAFHRSPFSISFDLSRVRGDDVLMIYDIIGTTVWDASYYQEAVQSKAAKLEQAKESAQLKSGRMPVLFAPSGALVLGLPLMEGLNGKNVYTRTSPMAGRMGETLFDPKITVVDDPLIPGKFGSAAYDDEGVAHRRNVLVDRGVLQGFLYDLKTAAQSGVESTGNGSRGLFSQPSPQPTNLTLAPGETPLADMIAGIEHGLLVEDVLGLGQGNVISGAFSNSLSLAFRIEKGQIAGRVKDVSIAGNIYELLQNVAAVSRETEWVYSHLALPYILLDDMNVVTKE